ncbi:DHR-2, Lobe A [Popillia japonica]|uniref:DHR-2, Lobe A n=1 Tax=Popillia japonica TaxID=7064 RepID=A0AAW1ISD8_POPJA
MTCWHQVQDEQSYGVAIYNFSLEGEYKMKFTCGDAVHIWEECDDWYRGCLVHKRNVVGIFPKNYIYLKECVVDKSYTNLAEYADDTTAPPLFVLKQPPIVQEITAVLREWGTHWKKFYVTHNKNFELIQKQIYDLINHRNKILSGTLPTDELRQITKQVTNEIDMGNKILGLDMVVRDKHGHLLDPDNTSTIDLYNHHKNATERMNLPKTEAKETPVKTAIQQFSHIFIVSVKNFTCKMNEDAELLMTLYDAKENRPITESYVVRWSKDGLMRDLDQMHNLRVMFTDLGKKDLERERIYLVCYVIRIGSMDTKEPDHRRSSMTMLAKKPIDEGMRRPFGVAAKDVTVYMNGKFESDLEQEFSIPFYNCEKDNLEQTLRKIMNRDPKNEFKQNQCLFVSWKLLHGDVKQVREENPHLVLGNVSIARKMGFPEVILPGDVRNDLYLMLQQGEFPKGNKTSDKNVEVIVKVCNEKGEQIPGVIYLGGDTEPMDEYHSVIYYHEDKPQWFETFKVAIPIEEFKTSHLKFYFKHRSSNEMKDKNEKPFAMAYVKLMQDVGTTLKDNEHVLAVYKIDHKKFNDFSIDYFQLPSTMDELKMSINKVQAPGLFYTGKESFVIRSNICSTKLTQNVDLLGLLNWSTHKDTLRQSLESLRTVIEEKSGEVVKFFQDILDALFDILMDNADTEMYDELVFQCLLAVIGLVSNNWKYQHFEPVLDLYIKESFSATLAYRKLIAVMSRYITNIYDKSDREQLYKTMRSLQYIVRFITRSRLLYIKMYHTDINDDFDQILKELLDGIVQLMCEQSDNILREQGACLKYLPSTIPDILEVYDPKRLSVFFFDLLSNIPQGKLTKQKMMTTDDIVHSQLFLYPECRKILMPYITSQIKRLVEQAEEGQTIPGQDGRKPHQSVAKVARLLGETEHKINQHRGYSEEVISRNKVELCMKTLSDTLNLLFRNDIGPTFNDIMEIVSVDLRMIVQSHINMDKQSPLAGNVVAIMIDIFRQMSFDHYEKYIKQFHSQIAIKEFLIEIVIVFKGLVSQPVFSADWCEMIMLQNFVILKALRYCSRTIRDYFFENFDQQAWSNFFHSAIAFMTQPALQLEMFSSNKRLRIYKRYKDMRREMGFEVRSMWFNLGQNKLKFVPSLVGLILEMTLIPEPELRKATIPIFFDMMQCEFYSSKFAVESFGDTKRDSSHIKANFNEFEDTMIVKLDTLVEGGSGDENYKDLFYDIMLHMCSQHAALKDGVRFVEMIKRLMERLLEYRNIINDENKENRMSCIVNLLDFYSEINRKEMYIRYVNKLCDLHLECGNYTEAAYTLQLHSKLLNWSDDVLPPLLKTNRYTDIQTHRQLKEALYDNIIENYSKGNMWECALEKCQELVKQYEEETFDYEQLSQLHRKMADFYDSIMKKMRSRPEYFRVGYYGLGFPKFLQNKIFIYRGKDYERISEFSSRVLNEFPHAQPLNTLAPPEREILESNGQFIQINKVDPVMDEKTQRFSGKPVAEQIVTYYKVNHVNKFQYSRPFTRILRWFPVNSIEKYEISPLRNAIETMDNSNKELRDLFLQYNKDKSLNLNPLSLKLTGIVDPAVMGGIMNYENAFFTDEYIQNNPDDDMLIQKLKDLIAEQIPLLELCIQIHGERSSPSLLGLQKRLETCFETMKDDVIEKYGKKTCDLKIENVVTIRRHYSMAADYKALRDSPAHDTGSRGRVPSITSRAAQVTSLRTLTSLSFSTSSPQFASKSAVNNGNIKSSILSSGRTNNSTLSSKRGSKTPKDKRKSNKVDISSSPNTSLNNENNTINALTPNGTPVFELRQELTPQRPLRSEIEKEKRLSRPNSGQYSRPPSISLNMPPAYSSGNSSNRDSIGTTDSSISEEDLVPPPLPLKSREVDYCNLPLPPGGNQSFLYSHRSSIKSFMSGDKPLSESEQVKVSESPPTPPPKPPKKKRQ